MKKTFTSAKKLVAVIAALVCFSFSQKSPAQVSVSSFAFKQYNRYNANGSLLFSGSSMGQVSFAITQDPLQTYYLNIYAKNKSQTEDRLIVQNFPVVSTACGTSVKVQVLKIDYKLLDYVPGEKVGNIVYSFTLSPFLSVVTDTISTKGSLKLNSQQVKGPKPLVFAASRVVPMSFRNEMSAAYNEFTKTVMFKITLPVNCDTIQHKGVPKVEEDSLGCVQGSFARSIAWLNSEYKLGSALKPQEIYDSLVNRFKGCENEPNVDSCKVARKSDFLKKLAGNKGATTTWVVPPPADVNAWLRDKMKTCDVELGIDWGGNDGTHAITVTAIMCDSTGCCTIKYRDDSDQGHAGGDEGEKTARICGDSIEVDGSNYKVLDLVSECIDNPKAKFSGSNNANDILSDFVLAQNRPNPFSDKTNISFSAVNTAEYKQAFIIIRNMNGDEVSKLSVKLHDGINTVTYTAPSDIKGTLFYSLEVDGMLIGTKQMLRD